MTPQQLTALKNDIAANTATILLGTGPTQIKDTENTLDINGEVAAWYNGVAEPGYWLWRSDVRRVDVYTAAPAEATAWDWTGFKNQSIPEHNAWFEMFMGGTCNFSNANNRAGALAIFGTAGAGGNNRTHIFNSVRRLAKRIEKLLAVAVLNPPANTGNTAVARGSAGNPDAIGFEGAVNGNDITAARTP